jgi:predicted transcriptional regulator
MGTITINLKDDIELEFREIADIMYGNGKGHLGKALAEAVQNWIEDWKQENIAEDALAIMNTDFHSGGWTYPHRSELYD